jgi:hypothetical protein
MRGRARSRSTEHRELLPVPIERAPNVARERSAGAVEPAEQLSQVRDDELPGGRRGRGADVRGEIAERGVLLVSDGRDHGDRALGDRADDALVAEGEKILEAAAAAGQDDHVDVWVLAESADRCHDLGGCARALHVSLGDEDRGGREAGPDRRHDVALRGCVVAGHDPDASWQQWQWALAGVGEEALGGEGRLQPLE